jgi:hypothetical protein
VLEALKKNIRTKNIKQETDGLVQHFIENLKRKKEIEGIVLLGGLGKRAFLDENSDLDLSIFLKKRRLHDWLPPFEFHVCHGGRDFEFNVHQQILENEIAAEWSEEKKEAYSRGSVVYDRNGQIRKFLEKKTGFDKKYKRQRIIWLMGQYPWYAKINPLRTLDRGFPEASHDLLNQAVELIVEITYLINEKYRPHKKWRIPVVFTLSDNTKNFRKNLKEAMLVKNYSKKDIKRRMRVLHRMYKKQSSKVKARIKNFPRDPYKYACKRLCSRQLLIDTFPDKITERLNGEFNESEKKQLHGFLSFNLTSSIEEAKAQLAQEKKKNCILTKELCDRFTRFLNKRSKS